MTIKQACKTLLAALGSVLGFLCLGCNAGHYDGEYNDESALFYADSMKLSDMPRYQSELVPIHLMDDETLLRSAEIEKSSGMSVNQRIMNNRWLAANSSNTYSGTRALREFFRLNIRSYISQSRSSDSKVSISHDMYSNTLSITRLNNYRIDISDDKVFLKYQQRFSF